MTLCINKMWPYLHLKHGKHSKTDNFEENHAEAFPSGEVALNDAA